MAMKRTRKLPISSEPSDPATNPVGPGGDPSDPVEAAKWGLAKLCRQMENHVDEYKHEPDQTGVSPELVQWFVAAVI